MKKLFKYFGILLSVTLMGAFTSCNLLEPEEEVTEVVLGIKTFAPMKVVPGMEMTISGSCFDQVTEVVFPDEVAVTNFKKVTNEMIRVTVPKGVNVEGGKMIVRGEGVQAESKSLLSVGDTKVTGFSKQAGEEITGGEQLTVFGTDLEFINKVELLDADGNTQFVEDKAFYRKGTSTVVIIIPKTNIFEGTWVGKLHTIDGKVFPLPELSYAPGAEGGHWEKQLVPFWTNDNPDDEINWSSVYRFCLEGHDTNPAGKECIAEFPEAIWNRIKSETLFVVVKAEDPQVRITTGWWDPSFQADDFQPGNDLLTNNEDGTWTLAVNLSSNPDFVAAIDERHLLFTGARFGIVSLNLEEDVWIEGGGEGHMEIVKNVFWTNEDPEGNGAVSWSGVYRFALDGNDGNNECIATFPEDVWTKIKTGTFHIRYTAADPTSYQVRVTNGWWDTQWLGANNDVAPWANQELITDNEDGTFSIVVTLGDDPLVETLDQKHLLITGSGFTPLELYFEEEVWVGPQAGPVEVDFWVNDDPEGNGAVSWSGVYRFALDGNDGNNECIATFPEDVWNKIKTGTFYINYTAADPTSYQVRVTNGWWDTQWLGANNDVAPWAYQELITDNEDGTFTIEVTLGDDPLVETLDQKHLLITGSGFTPMKLFFLE